jgi:hypothetical protein
LGNNEKNRWSAYVDWVSGILSKNRWNAYLERVSRFFSLITQQVYWQASF